MLDLINPVRKSVRAALGIWQSKNSFILPAFFQLSGHLLCGKQLVQIQKEWMIWANLCLVLLVILILSQIFLLRKNIKNYKQLATCADSTNWFFGTYVIMVRNLIRTLQKFGNNFAQFDIHIYHWLYIKAQYRENLSLHLNGECILNYPKSPCVYQESLP